MVDVSSTYFIPLQESCYCFEEERYLQDETEVMNKG